MKTIAIYHKDCTDGTTAAAIVLKKYPDALLFPMAHGYVPEELSPVLSEAKPGDRILTVDCVMGAKEFLALGYSVISIDHHAGIEEEYKALAAANKNFTFVFDNSKSGASLSWSYFFPEEPMPELVKYVEDADLWKWTYGQKSKDANNFLFMLENKPEEMLALFDKPTDSVLGNGSLISRYIGITLDQDLREVEPINIAVGDHVVPFYNITHNKSDAGNSLSKLRDKTVGLFTIKGPTITISFRCLDKHVPSALDLAKALGGGGHRNASGASMRLEDFIRAIRK